MRDSFNIEALSGNAIITSSFESYATIIAKDVIMSIKYAASGNLRKLDGNLWPIPQSQNGYYATRVGEQCAVVIC